MQDFLKLVGSFTLVFALSYALTFMFTQFLKKRHPELVPAENDKIRFKTSEGMFRCRYVREDVEGWHFSAPMQRDHYVPLAVGTELTCEAITQHGVLIFESTVINRRLDPARIVVTAPAEIKIIERRDRQRVTDMAEMDITIDGQKGKLIDRSSGGIKVVLGGFLKEGEAVEVNFPNGEFRHARVVATDRTRGETIARLAYLLPKSQTGNA